MYNVRCENTLVEVPCGCLFQEVIHLLNDKGIIGFSCEETGRIISPSEEVQKDMGLIKIYSSHIVANLLNAFSLVLGIKISDFLFKDEGGFIKECVVKFKTDKTFSESDFDLYKTDIKKKVFLNNMNDNPVLADLLCNNHLSILPFDFSIEKVAQEESDGVKVQKFTISIFKDAEDRSSYQKSINFLKTIDHRYIGKNLGYFMMIPDSPGCVFWLEKGWKLFRNLENLIRKEAYIGFQEVKTPLVMANSFWKKSGHLVSFKQNMMFVNMGEDSSEDAALKPMNCPAHIEIFQKSIRSYKELPLRLAEFGCCHRYEPSGSLHGLMRVRSLTQDDGHIFCSIEQVKSETVRFLDNCIRIYKKLGFNDIEVVLATKPENALGDPDEWIVAEEYLSESLKAVGLGFSVAEGEGAFYGPKIEMHVKDSIGRSWQLGTIQLDFVLPQRFDLSFIDSNGQKAKVCMLHRAILGSLERFIGVLLEHCHGRLPIFLAPVQAAICSITDESNEYAEKVHSQLSSHGVDSILDVRKETLGYKIREHRNAKIPALVVIGKEEVKNNTLTLEYLGQKMVFKLDEVEKIMGLFNENR